MSAKLDINALKVATACPARWEDMAGDERARFCLHCQKHVYNFSAMTAKEVEDLVVAKEGKLCGRMYRRRDGTVLTADCPTGKAVVQRNRVQWFAGAVAGLGLLVSTLWAKGQSRDEEAASDSEFTAAVKEKWYELEMRLGIVKPMPMLGKMCVPISAAQPVPPPQPTVPSTGGNPSQQPTP